MMNLQQMKAERDRLNAEIKAAETREREEWNDGLSECERVLGEYLTSRKLKPREISRSGDFYTWQAADDRLRVTFGEDAGDGERALSLYFGGQVSAHLEWLKMPVPASFITIVDCMLKEAAVTDG